MPAQQLTMMMMTCTNHPLSSDIVDKMAQNAEALHRSSLSTLEHNRKLPFQLEFWNRISRVTCIVCARSVLWHLDLLFSNDLIEYNGIIPNSTVLQSWQVIVDQVKLNGQIATSRSVHWIESSRTKRSDCTKVTGWNESSQINRSNSIKPDHL